MAVGGCRAAERSLRRPGTNATRGRARQWYDVTVKGRFSRQAMADIDITQAEADALIAMEKQCVDDKRLVLPGPGERLAVSLTSLDKRESFMLDVTRAQIKLTKATYQNRAFLMRLDLGGLTFEAFRRHCNITVPPYIQLGLFS